MDEQLKVKIVVDKSDFNKGITDVKKELKSTANSTKQGVSGVSQEVRAAAGSIRQSLATAIGVAIPSLGLVKKEVKALKNEIKEYKTNTTDTKENTEMKKKKKDILLLQFDGGNGCTKIYYEIPTKDGKVKKVQKVVKSCIDIVADADDTYTLNGLTKVNGVAYNFNTSKSVIETSKENKKHNNSFTTSYCTVTNKCFFVIISKSQDFRLFW